MSGVLLPLAAMLRRLRSSGRPIPIGAVEALLLIGAGVDSVPDLAAAMGHDGAPMPPASVSRLISMLRGRARYDMGRWVESPYNALVVVRSHPHRKGFQLMLSEAGAELLNDMLASTGPPYTCTSLLAPLRCASREEDR